MSARLVLPPDAPREEWLAARRLGITASEIAVVLGISPFDSAFNLYYKKRGEISEDFDNAAMSLGRHLEPWIADRWAESQSGWLVAPGRLWQNTDRPWQLATTDRDLYHLEETTIGVPHSVLEIKSSGTYDGWGEDGSDEIPPYYRAQVLWQLDTLGLETAHVTCLFLSSRSIRNYTVSWFEEDVKLMRYEAVEFLRRIEDGDPPPVDHTPATAHALKQLHDMDPDAEATVPADLADDYRYAKRSLDDAQANYDLLTNQIRHAMGDAKKAVDPDGGKVATRSVYEQTRVDAKRLRTEFPEAFAACRVASTVDKLTPSRAKKDTP